MGITQQIFFSPGFFAIQKSFQSWNFGVWEKIEEFLFQNFEKYVLLKTNCSIYNCSNRMNFFLNFYKIYCNIFAIFWPIVSVSRNILEDSNISILSFSRESMLFKKSVVDPDLVLIFGDCQNRKKLLSQFFTNLAFFN